MNTPLVSDSNENETQTEQNKQHNGGVNQLLNEKNGQLSEETFIIKFFYLPIVLIASIISILLTLIAIFGEFNLWFRIFLPIFGVIFSLILLYIIVNKIILVKDSSNKKILIKVVNYLCLTKMKLNFDLENIHFYLESKDHVVDDERFTTERLFIINNYKNFVGIDLNENNIKQKPAKCFYSFKHPISGKYSYNQFEKLLNDFVGSSRDYKNPLLFDINTHIQENKEVKLNYWQKQKYIKISDFFFSYYLKGYQNGYDNLTTIDTIFIYIIINFDFFLFFISVGLIIVSITEKFYIGLLIILLSDIIINLIFYSLYKCCKYCKENILRIDFIKSKNLNSIFIGVVKYNKTKYVNTFEFQKDNINKFIYEREGDSNSTNFNLKVLFKNEESQQICTLKKQTQNELEGLICYLNGEFMNTTNPGPNSYEQI
jgi:hypothetical protein